VKFKIKLKEPYKTALILGLTTSIVIGGAYLVMPETWRQNVKDFVAKKFGKKKEVTEEIKTE
jgi:hypothetical protein